MPRPLPPRLSAAFGSVAFGNGSRSLFHARGMDQYGAGWTLGENKKVFLEQAARIACPDYGEFLKRRRTTLESAAVGAVGARITSSSLLVCGLGLPHPAGTSLLLDRLTGAPYLPGSSVKGMLREAARLAAAREFPDDVLSQGAAEYWGANADRVFGAGAEGSGSHLRGGMTFFDAFPSQMPSLKLDVLTPHYGPYYMDGNPPGDWFSPVPVYYLAVSPGVEFQFWYRSVPAQGSDKVQDEARVGELLPVALDWLGIGGKRSSGYGMFSADSGGFGAAFEAARPSESAAPRAPHYTTRPEIAHQGARDAEVTPGRDSTKLQCWENCQITYLLGRLVASKGRTPAVDVSGLLAAALKESRRKPDSVLATVEVVRFGSEWRIHKVLKLVPKT